MSTTADLTALETSLIALIRDKFRPRTQVITKDSTFVDLELDSLSQVELGPMLEERYDISFTDLEMQELSTVGEILGTLAAKGATV
jgi:acyl carrier protein